MRRCDVATIVDEFIVALGLDAKALKQEQKEALDQLHRFEKKAEEAGKKSGDQSKKTHDSIMSFGKHILGLAGIYVSARAAMQFAEAVHKGLVGLGTLAATTGLNAGKLKAFGDVIAQVGGTSEGAAAAIGAIQKSLDALQIDPNAARPLRELLAVLGVDIRNGQGGIKDAIDLYGDLVEAFAQSRMSIEEFGTRMRSAGFTEEMIAMATRGAAAYRRAMEAAQKLTTSLPEDIEAAKKREAIYAKMTAAMESAARTFLTTVSPLLVGFSKTVEDVIDLAAKVASLPVPDWFMKIMAGVLRSGLFGGIGSGAMALWDIGQEELKNEAYQEHLRSGFPPAATAGPGKPTFRSGVGPGARARQTERSDVTPTGEKVTNLANDRERFKREIEQDAGLKRELFKHAIGEQTSSLGNQAILETAMNRASLRRTKLRDELRYFQGYREYSKAEEAMMERNLERVFGGSNESFGSTDNASGWLAEKHRRTGMYRARREITGETVFVPGKGEPGWSKKYPDWARQRGIDPETGKALAVTPAPVAPAAPPAAPPPPAPQEQPRKPKPEDEHPWRRFLWGKTSSLELGDPNIVAYNTYRYARGGGPRYKPSVENNSTSEVQVADVQVLVEPTNPFGQASPFAGAYPLGAAELRAAAARNDYGLA